MILQVCSFIGINDYGGGDTAEFEGLARSKKLSACTACCIIRNMLPVLYIRACNCVLCFGSLRSELSV
jgi:hypothetical protein